jgi:hypothetical protein
VKLREQRSAVTCGTPPAPFGRPLPWLGLRNAGVV